MFENITKSFQESIMGWKMLLGGGSDRYAVTPHPLSPSPSGGEGRGERVRSIGTALIGPGFSTTQQRFVGVKAGEVVQVMQNSAQAPVGVRYMTASRSPPPLPPPPVGEGRGEGTQYDPGTPATVVERIQKSIGNSVEGWRMGYAYVAGKAKEAVTGAQKGISSTVGGIGESFGDVADSFKSIKWGFYILIPIIIFIAIMVAIGYSGVGAPAARVAEREYVKRR